MIPIKAISGAPSKNWKLKHFTLCLHLNYPLEDSMPLSMKQNRQRSTGCLWQSIITPKKKILPRKYTCTLSFSTNDWNRWFLIISLIFCGETKGIKLCIQWKLIRDRKSRKQPDGLLFHNWLIQRIPLPFSEIVFRPITQTCKFSFHSKEM